MPGSDGAVSRCQAVLLHSAMRMESVLLATHTRRHVPRPLTCPNGRGLLFCCVRPSHSRFGRDYKGSLPACWRHGGQAAHGAVSRVLRRLREHALPPLLQPPHDQHKPEGCLRNVLLMTTAWTQSHQTRRRELAIITLFCHAPIRYHQLLTYPLSEHRQRQPEEL